MRLRPPCSSVTHNTHVLVLPATALALFPLARIGLPAGHAMRERAASLLAIALLAIPLVGTLNFLRGRTFSAARGANVFLLYRFAHSGVLVEALDCYCGERSWALCAHRDELERKVGEVGWLLRSHKSPQERGRDKFPWGNRYSDLWGGGGGVFAAPAANDPRRLPAGIGLGE